jgi:WD40 repeat protein
VALFSEPRDLAYRPDGARLAVLCAGGQVALADPARGRVVKTWNVSQPFPHNTHYVHNGALAWAPDGRSLLTWGIDDAVRVWDPDSGRLRYPPLRHGPGLTHDVAFAPGGRYLATSAYDRTVRLWDARTGAAVRPPIEHPDWVFAVRFSRDGRHLLTTCRDGMARVWDWRAGRLAAPPMAHRNEIHAGTFTPDGRRVLTASLDNTARAWDWRTGKPVAPPWRLHGMGLSADVTPDGRRLVVGGFAGALDLIALDDLNPRPGHADGELLRAELLSGRRIESGGGVTTLTSAEWLRRWRRFPAGGGAR